MSNKHGFTLMEMLVAIAIFTILMSIVFLAISMGMTSMQAGRAKAHAQEAARYAMNFISRELSDALGVSDILPPETHCKDCGITLEGFRLTCPNCGSRNVTHYYIFCNDCETKFWDFSAILDNRCPNCNSINLTVQITAVDFRLPKRDANNQIMEPLEPADQTTKYYVRLAYPKYCNTCGRNLDDEAYITCPYCGSNDLRYLREREQKGYDIFKNPYVLIRRPLPAQAGLKFALTPKSGYTLCDYLLLCNSCGNSWSGLSSTCPACGSDNITTSMDEPFLKFSPATIKAETLKPEESSHAVYRAANGMWMESPHPPYPRFYPYNPYYLYYPYVEIYSASNPPRLLYYTAFNSVDKHLWVMYIQDIPNPFDDQPVYDTSIYPNRTNQPYGFFIDFRRGEIKFAFSRTDTYTDDGIDNDTLVKINDYTYQCSVNQSLGNLDAIIIPGTDSVSVNGISYTRVDTLFPTGNQYRIVYSTDPTDKHLIISIRFDVNNPPPPGAQILVNYQYRNNFDIARDPLNNIIYNPDGTPKIYDHIVKTNYLTKSLINITLKIRKTVGGERAKNLQDVTLTSKVRIRNVKSWEER